MNKNLQVGNFKFLTSAKAEDGEMTLRMGMLSRLRLAFARAFFFLGQRISGLTIKDFHRQADGSEQVAESSFHKARDSTFYISVRLAIGNEESAELSVSGPSKCSVVLSSFKGNPNA